MSRGLRLICNGLNGYRLHARAKDAGSQYGVVVNSAKSETLVFGGEDRIIVLAES